MKMNKEGLKHAPKYFESQKFNGRDVLIYEFVEYSVEEYLQNISGLQGRLNMV